MQTRFDTGLVRSGATVALNLNKSAAEAALLYEQRFSEHWYGFGEAGMSYDWKSRDLDYSAVLGLGARW